VAELEKVCGICLYHCARYTGREEHLLVPLGFLRALKSVEDSGRNLRSDSNRMRWMFVSYAPIPYFIVS